MITHQMTEPTGERTRALPTRTLTLPMTNGVETTRLLEGNATPSGRPPGQQPGLLIPYSTILVGAIVVTTVCLINLLTFWNLAQTGQRHPTGDVPRLTPPSVQMPPKVAMSSVLSPSAVRSAKLNPPAPVKRPLSPIKKAAPVPASAIIMAIPEPTASPSVTAIIREVPAPKSAPVKTKMKPTESAVIALPVARTPEAKKVVTSTPAPTVLAPPPAATADEDQGTDWLGVEGDTPPPEVIPDIDKLVPPANEAPAAGGKALPALPVSSAQSVRAELNRHLGDWARASALRDIDGQMLYYAPHLMWYFNQKHVSRDYIRRQRERLFEKSNWVAVDLSEVTISVAPDRRHAVARFRKDYDIVGGPANGTGAVLEELRWERLGPLNEWKIVSQRDLKVLPPTLMR